MCAQIRRTSMTCILLVLLGGVFQTATADTEANKAISRRDFEEALNQGKLEVYDEIIAPEAILHTVSGDIFGLDTIKGASELMDILHSVETAKTMEDIAELTEELHAVNHVISDSLEEK